MLYCFAAPLLHRALTIAQALFLTSVRPPLKRRFSKLQPAFYLQLTSNLIVQGYVRKLHPGTLALTSLPARWFTWRVYICMFASMIFGTRDS